VVRRQDRSSGDDPAGRQLMIESAGYGQRNAGWREQQSIAASQLRGNPFGV
jgi:hypothetical protein